MGRTIIIDYNTSLIIKDLLDEGKLSAQEIHDKYYPDMDLQLFNAIVSADPTAKNGGIGKYTKWIANLAKQGKWKPGDKFETVETLTRFSKNFQKLPKKDINQYTSLDELMNAVASSADIRSRSEVRGDIEEFYEDSEWKVIVPLTKEAAQLYGKGTRWCTSAMENNRFQYYSEQGKLYIIINKTNGRKYQFCFEPKQFMDEDDSPVTIDDVNLPSQLVEKFYHIYGENSLYLAIFKIQRDPDYIRDMFNPETDDMWEVVDYFKDSDLPEFLSVLEALCANMPADVVFSSYVEPFGRNLDTYKFEGDYYGYKRMEGFVLVDINGRIPLKTLIYDYRRPPHIPNTINPLVAVSLGDDGWNYFNFDTEELLLPVPSNCFDCSDFVNGTGIVYLANGVCFVDAFGRMTQVQCNSNNIDVSLFNESRFYTVVYSNTFNKYNIVGRDGKLKLSKWVYEVRIDSSDDSNAQVSVSFDNIQGDTFTCVINRATGVVDIDNIMGQYYNNNTDKKIAENRQMGKTIIISEDMAGKIKDSMLMTQFKFNSNIKRFLAELLEDPVNCQPDPIFAMNGIDKNKLIKSLSDGKVIVKKMNINDHDADGKPHTAMMTVKYSVPKERFQEKLDALYDTLFPDVEAKINEEGGAGGGATSCSGVDGNGFGSGEFIQPLFGVQRRKIKKNVGGDPYQLDEDNSRRDSLNESQESKSIDAAKRLFMQRTGKSPEEADKFVRVDLRNDLPVLRDKNGGKFILGVTRMFLDRQLTDASTILNLNKTLKLLTQGNFNEYDRNLNGMSAQDVISRFSTAMKQMDDQEREELAGMEFTVNNDYQIVRIDDFEQSSQYGQDTSWCVTHDEDMFDSYTSDGIGQFYFCLRNGFENEPEKMGEGCPLDSYGLSMIAVSVDENGRLNTCTCRWNHSNGGNDNIMDVKQISQIIGRNFFDVFKPNGRWQEVLNDAMTRLRNGESPEDVFDLCGDFSDGFAAVSLNSKWNWVRADNGQLFSDQWYDYGGDFSEGMCRVELNSKWNWLRADNGQMFSDQWFDSCDDFREGIGRVELNSKWNWLRADNGQFFSDQWFDWCGNFSDGLAMVGLNGKCNWVRTDNGRLLSDQWFDLCRDFYEGFALVVLNGQYYKIRRDGVLCDYNTRQPIQQQSGLNEMVNLPYQLDEAVTGEDGRKSSAVYAYVKNSKGEWCVLAAKRNKNKYDDEGGKMNPPMGHRHKYESAEDGAVRECEEESGIKFDKKDLVLASKEAWGTNFKIYLSGNTSDYKPGEGDEENTKFRWIPVSEIGNYEWAWSCGKFAKKFAPKKRY